MLDASNSSGKVWADTAYRTKSNEAWLKANGFFSHIHRRKPRGKPMPEHIRRGDATRSIIRSCVEHVFGQEKGPMDLSIRTIGIERATTKMTLANLAYNMKPLIFHERRKTMAWLRPKSENHPFRRAKGPENNPNLRLPHKIHLWRGAPMNTRFIILKCKPSFQSVQLYLRDALYMPALVASRFNPCPRNKYQAMINAEKPAKVALTTIMRKLIELANTLFRAEWKPKLA